MSVLIAQPSDTGQLERLLNSTYRGNGSKKGWTTEADLISGEIRTNSDALMELMNTNDAVFLKYENEGSIAGCVYLQKTGDKLYLGMLSVSPLLQAKGIGKQLLSAADSFARQKQCKSIYMKVINVRRELIAWYERHGYHATGETEPFPTDQRFGVPTQPVEFIIMEKEL